MTLNTSSSIHDVDSAASINKPVPGEERGEELALDITRRFWALRRVNPSLARRVALEMQLGLDAPYSRTGSTDPD